MNFEFDTEKVVSVIRSAFRIVLWVMVVFFMFYNEWLQVIAATGILAVLELEEMNQKMDDQ
jgi:phosphatidylglycerophosphate synthase